MVTIEDLKLGKEKICVVGLGYVGLPLAVYLAEHFSVIGFDINEQRIQSNLSAVMKEDLLKTAFNNIQKKFKSFKKFTLEDAKLLWRLWVKSLKKRKKI